MIDVKKYAQLRALAKANNLIGRIDIDPTTLLELLDALEAERLQVCHLLLDITELNKALQAADELAGWLNKHPRVDQYQEQFLNRLVIAYRAARGTK